MTLDEFIQKYNGKYVEYHSYGTGALNQCIDLVNQYIVEVLNKQAVIGTNAQDVPSKVTKDDYDYILNTPTGVPTKGDIVIFKSADKVGHISVFVEGTATKFTSFDQNYPTGSPCILVGHYYTNVLGWLHPKDNANDALASCMADRAKFWKERDEEIAKIAELTQKLTDIKLILDATNDIKNDLDAKLVKSETELAKAMPLATKWQTTKTIFKLDSPELIETLFKEQQAQILALQNSTTNNQVLKECRANLATAKKDSVKTATKKVLIQELVKRFLHK